MHYLGMMAQRMNATMELDLGIVALSSVIAFATANAAFWILFRAVRLGFAMEWSQALEVYPRFRVQLTFWPCFESLRLGSALIMGVAVCGTHYSGMGAASYKYTEENYADSTRFLVRGIEASTIASHAALLLCYWLSTGAVVVSLRKEILSSNASRNKTTMKSNMHKPSKAAGPGQSGNHSEAPVSHGGHSHGPQVPGLQPVIVSSKVLAFNAVAPSPPSGPRGRSLGK
jgi:hypothetical protein